MQVSKLYIGWFDDKGKPFVEANGVLLPIIPYYTDYEANLALTILANFFNEMAPIGSPTKCVFYAQDLKRDIVVALPKDQHWQLMANEHRADKAYYSRLLARLDFLYRLFERLEVRRKSIPYPPFQIRSLLFASISGPHLFLCVVF